MNLLQTAYCWISLSFLIHSVTVCLLIGGFNPFTLRVITNRGGLTIAIFTVFCMFFPSLSLFPAPTDLFYVLRLFFFCSDESLARLIKDSNN